jgi:3-hydroxybutyryl-CoA dehydrogenase
MSQSHPVMSVQRIAVVGGAGQMGNGIAQVAAAAGFDVIAVDVSEEALARGRARILKSLDRMVKAEQLTRADADATIGRISDSTDLDASAAAADHVIETVPEDLDLKRDVLRRVDSAAKADVIIASNTSQFSISQLAAATARPDRVIGTHWFNPPPLMGLIEVIRGVATSDETLGATLGLAGQFGKETVVCQKDTQGFVTSRLIMLWCIEAMRIVEEGIASVEDVNKACRLAFNHPMGPLEIADLGGLDSVVAAGQALSAHYGERYRLPQNVRALVAAGHYGHKTGRGFRDYGEAR